MADSDLVVASAVVVPNLGEEERSPPLPLKRRQSSASHDSSKRPRLSEDDGAQIERSNRPDPSQGASTKRQVGRDMDERKRGKRLFGALLGTLAQNSSSTAQKRRTDIEKKQREKLKLQGEEDDEKKKQRLDTLMMERQREQKLYDEQTVHLKHSNMLATAYFLRTTTEPMLYYKPWELRPDEKARIELQISKAEGGLHVESTESTETVHQKLEEGSNGAKSVQVDGHSTENIKEGIEPVGTWTNEAEGLAIKRDSNVATQPTPPSNNSQLEGFQEVTKDTMDEGGDDMVEGEEDAVIY